MGQDVKVAFCLRYQVVVCLYRGSL